MAQDWDVIGYVYEGDIYCDDCTRADGTDPDSDENYGVYGAVFDSNESDCPEHCGNYTCRKFLGGTLTREGWRYVKEAILEGHREYVHEYMSRWPHYDWYFIPTFHGWMDPMGDFKENPEWETE